jgi:hypothetical protein
MKNLKQMNDYVNKRREVLEKQKEYEKYKKKRLGEDISSYNIKLTIPRKFQLKTEERSRSHSKDNYFDKKNYSNKYIKDINSEREEMNTYSFFNNQNNNFNYNNSPNVNVNSQQEFIDAINALHCKIDNLNI